MISLDVAAGDLAADARDLALEFAHPAVAGVQLHDVVQGGLGNVEAHPRETVALAAVVDGEQGRLDDGAPGRR